MNTTSIWNTFIEPRDPQQLVGETHADVVIIGGGITGLTTADILTNTGFNVVLLEAAKIASGTTSHSTGNLYQGVDHNFSILQKKYNQDYLKNIIQARGKAIDFIEELVTKYSLNCEFERVPWHLYSGSIENKQKIIDEYKTIKELGIELKIDHLNKCPYPVQNAITIENQAQFHPLKFCLGLFQSLSERCRIFELSPVIEIKEERDQSVIYTPKGKITTKYVVHATHTPKGVMMVQTLLGPYREYGIAVKLKYAHHPKGIFWGLYENDQHISTRVNDHKGEHFLIIVGEAHKVGQTESSILKIKKLESFARKYFQFDEVNYHWSAQHYRPADLVPYIGVTHHPHTYVATGFSTDGLTWGVASAKIIADHIMGIQNDYAQAFQYKRLSLAKSAVNFVKENTNVLGQYLKDLPGHTDARTFNEVADFEGKIIEMDGQKLAVSRDAEHNLHVCSAVCTHLSCIVKWNDLERSWDCPCHGSRFSCDGEIIEGPATQNLDSIVIEGEHVHLRESSWTSSQPH